jgi:hypothetical protein
MPRKEGPLGSEAVQEIKAKLSLINAIGAFVAFLLLGIIVGALYRPVREYFVFLPELSLYVIVLFAFVLLLAGSISSRVLSQRVVIVAGLEPAGGPHHHGLPEQARYRFERDPRDPRRDLR